ncbi:hypothetical protein [Solimicrobium silvestre]|uniref:Uncharacterized protein n=1 Tax=Solimicrobium silvestre TaxID=2099400 RepID=A0A2S9GWX8_9BURK|nr:hypothetical protein [Solimicrobium silvestre]PRC92166.1 hypothetical protein S2091_3082 [Solimicrobium silvestre]
MTSTDQIHTQQHPPLITHLAVDTIDAYTQARDIVSDLSAIFEVLDHLALTDFSNKRITPILFRAGFCHATERLEFIEEKITDAYKTLDELKADNGHTAHTNSDAG